MWKLKIQENIKFIEESDWSNFVSDIYGRPYNLQQQDNCKDRGIIRFSVPDPWYSEEDENELLDEIPEVINGEEMCVKFEKWLERDPKYNPFKETYELEIFWERNFYPLLGTVVEDLYKKELLEEGEYVINIDW